MFHVPSAADPEWMCDLQPYVHFIPVPLASNGQLETRLLGALAWARAHDQTARNIASRGRNFVRRLWQAPQMAHELSLRLRAAPHHPRCRASCRACAYLTSFHREETASAARCDGKRDV